jgi:hypothetical protein
VTSSILSTLLFALKYYETRLPGESRVAQAIILPIELS